jgi:hypothetical protein
MVESHRTLRTGNTAPFIELLEDFLKHRATMSIASYNESNLGMAVEIFWHEETQCVVEMRLVVDSAKERGDGRFGFVDIFAGDSEREFGHPNHMELSHLPLGQYIFYYMLKTIEANPLPPTASSSRISYTSSPLLWFYTALPKPTPNFPMTTS